MTWAEEKARETTQALAVRPGMQAALIHAAIREAIEQAVREVYDAEPFTRADVARRIRAMASDTGEGTPSK